MHISINSSWVSVFSHNPYTIDFLLDFSNHRRQSKSEDVHHWIENRTIRSPLPQHKPDSLLLPELHRFPSLRESQGWGRRGLPIFQTNLQIDVPERMGWEVGLTTRRGHLPRTYLNMLSYSKRMEWSTNKIQNSSKRCKREEIWNKLNHIQILLFKFSSFHYCFVLFTLDTRKNLIVNVINHMIRLASRLAIARWLCCNQTLACQVLRSPCCGICIAIAKALPAMMLWPAFLWA